MEGRMDVWKVEECVNLNEANAFILSKNAGKSKHRMERKMER